MTTLKDRLTELSDDHEPIELTTRHLRDVTRRRRRHNGPYTSVAAGLGVAATIGAITLLHPTGNAALDSRPAAADVVDTVTNAAASSNAITSPASPPGDSARTSGASGAPEAGAMQRAAQTQAECQLVLTRDKPNVFFGGTIDGDLVESTARSCSGLNDAAPLQVTWVTTTLDAVSAALDYHQQSNSATVAVIRVQGSDSAGDQRDLLLLLLPGGATAEVEGNTGEDSTIQQYPAVAVPPAGFDLSALGDVRRN